MSRSFLFLLWLAAAPAGAAAVPTDNEVVNRGAYLYRAGGCASCHTDEKGGGAENAGGVELRTPFGVFYGPNITPDPEHGIGKWTEADFLRALREGVNPKGQHYYPVFPYTSYTRLTDTDMRALWAYLRTRPPVAKPNRPHRVVWYGRMRASLGVWKRRYFTPGAFVPNPDKSATINRGAYLATAAAHCGECHTPRDRFGGFINDLYYAGTRDGPEDTVIPNITPDRATGLRWRESEIAEYLETGLTPDGDSAGDLMAEVIDNGLRYLTKDDLRAIAAYIRALPPVEHAVRKPKKKQKSDF